MSLPDLSRLALLSAEEWRDVGLWLAKIGVTAEAAERTGALGEGLPAGTRAALQRWHLRRMSGPAAVGLRLFMFGDTISESEACESLGGFGPRLEEAGLLVRRSGREIACPFELSIAGALYIFSDELRHGGGAVMGPSENTAMLCRAAAPGGRLGRVLDLGCGAGTAGLALARRAQRVVATDVNERALDMARLNAAINGIENIEFRAGDCYAPVENGSFDLIVSQPPFVARPPGSSDAAYLFGGPRGDETALRIVAGACGHLSPGGRAVVLAEWPEVESATVEERIAGAIPRGSLSVLHLKFPATEPDYACGMYAAAEARESGGSVDERVRIWRDHFESQGILGLRMICTVLQRPREAPAWNASLDVPAERVTAVTGSEIEQWIARYALKARGREALLKATLRLPKGTKFVKEFPTDGTESRTVLQVPEECLAEPVELREDSLLLISLLQESASVGEAVAAFCAKRGVARERVQEEVLTAVEQLLMSGGLEVASEGECAAG